jgi:hypothetical protein
MRTTNTTVVTRSNFLNLMAPAFVGVSVAAAALGADAGFYLGADLGRSDYPADAKLIVDLPSSTHRGTIFLDEVADLSLAAPAKILRVAQSGEIQKVGAEQTITVDVRATAIAILHLIFEICICHEIAGRSSVRPLDALLRLLRCP